MPKGLVCHTMLWCSSSVGSGPERYLYLPEVLQVGTPDTSYRESAVVYCLFATDRMAAGTRDLQH